MQEFKDYVIIIVGCATTLSLSFGIYYQRKSFILLKSKENENELFKLKLTVYSTILTRLEELLEKIYDEFLDVFENTFYPKNIQKMHETIDGSAREFDLIVVFNSLYMSNEVAISVDNLVIKIYKENETIMKENYKAFYDELEELSNNVNETIREELQLDQLTSNLYKRNRGF